MSPLHWVCVSPLENRCSIEKRLNHVRRLEKWPVLWVVANCSSFRVNRSVIDAKWVIANGKSTRVSGWTAVAACYWRWAMWKQTHKQHNLKSLETKKKKHLFFQHHCLHLLWRSTAFFFPTSLKFLFCLLCDIIARFVRHCARRLSQNIMHCFGVFVYKW